MLQKKNRRKLVIKTKEIDFISLNVRNVKCTQEVKSFRFLSYLAIKLLWKENTNKWHDVCFMQTIIL